MAGDFIPKSWATSIRIRKRCAGMSIAAPRWPLATLAAPIYLATPPGPRGRTGQRAMVNHVFVTDHPQPHPRVVPLQTLTRYDAPARGGTGGIEQL